MAHDEQGLFCDACEERVATLNVVDYRYAFDTERKIFTGEFCDVCLAEAPHYELIFVNPETHEDLPSPVARELVVRPLPREGA